MCCKNCFQKVVHKAGEFIGNRIGDTLTQTNDDKIEKQEPLEEIITRFFFIRKICTRKSVSKNPKP